MSRAKSTEPNESHKKVSRYVKAFVQEMHSVALRKLELLGILVLVSMQVHSHSTDPTRSSVIGQKFDTAKIEFIDQLMVECQILSAYDNQLSDTCVEKLADYFSDQPVWEQSIVYIPSLDRFDRLIPSLNLRPRILMISQSDVTGDVPMWSDIFDGKAEERRSIVERIVQDETCALLRNRGPISNDGSLSDQCHARELVKYAIYLDTCLTGMKRINRLLVTGARVDGRTRYEQAIIEWDHKLSEEENKIAQAELNESVMHAVWAHNACLSMPPDGYVATFSLTDSDRERVSAFVEEMTKQLQQIHDSAMSISARSGDSWGVRGFYVKELRRDKEYWKSLYKFNPLLFHRWMTEVGLAQGLSEREIVMHALKAFDLEKKHLDDRDLENYIEWHGFTRSNDSLLSLREKPMSDEELMQPWVDQETTD